MKTMLKVTLVIALAAFANTLFASGNLKVNLLPVSEKKAMVAISNLGISNLQITLTDEKEQIVYFSETSFPEENYHKVFDFSELKPGDYKITVVCDALTTERKFQKTHDAIKVGGEKTTLEPYFGYKDGILRCTYLNFQEENLKLSFFEKNQLIFSKEIGRNFNVGEALNLSKLSRGTYLAVLSAGDKEYSFTIEK